ncbi:hypothetical protein CMEL01_14745 [Colletotrichum melonis]|uniref:Rhodopsin domain-containing protein n=1 Tax=Colletotrichum melonis TaxID=1209925 RepID=A0AAI9UMB0_9PEZI|nr:hypothetical protein CMEL01_14745 [Colletotrichum melonis]
MIRSLKWENRVSDELSIFNGPSHPPTCLQTNGLLGYDQTNHPAIASLRCRSGGGHVQVHDSIRHACIALQTLLNICDDPWPIDQTVIDIKDQSDPYRIFPFSTSTSVPQAKVVLDGIRGVITVVMADKSAQIVVTASVFLLLTWVAVSLRVYCRTALVRSAGIDDKIMVFLLLWWILELLNVVSTCLLKISVGYFLLRVALDRPHIWIIRALMVGTIVFGTTYLFMVAFQCRPVPTYWEDGPRTPEKCWPSRVIYIMTIAATVINTSADFVFGALPWFIVRSMNLPIGTKIVVVCILGLAAVAFYIPTLLDGEDFLYGTSNFAIWSTVEPGIGIVAASIATLRPLYQMMLAKMGRSSVYRQQRDRLERQQARRDETSRVVRQAHNLDPEDGLADSDITSPHGILEVNPPSHHVSKQTESTVKTSSSGIGSPRLRMSLFDVDVPTSRLRLSDDLRRTMDRPSEEWLSRVKD